MKKIFSLSLVLILFIGLVTYSLLALFVAPNDRDEKRETFGLKILENIEAFKSDFGRYPPIVEFYEDYYQINPGIKVNLNQFYKFSDKSTPKSTSYKYYYFQGGFAFCIELENSTVKDFGNFTCKELEEFNK